VERTEMTPQEATVANTDIWAHYFEKQWGRWLDPFGLATKEVTQGNAARVAGFLTLVAAGPIAWMFAANAPQVVPMKPRAVPVVEDQPVAA
jgi:hypothetical protein